MRSFHRVPGVERDARAIPAVALLAPLALGLCFSTGLLWGRWWVAGHIALAIAAMMVIERATRSAPAPSGARTFTIQLEEMTND